MFVAEKFSIMTSEPLVPPHEDDFSVSRKTLQPKVTYSSQSNMKKNQKIGIFFSFFDFLCDERALIPKKPQNERGL